MRDVLPAGDALPALLGIAAVAALLSNVVNNLPAVLVLLPLVTRVGSRRGARGAHRGQHRAEPDLRRLAGESAVAQCRPPRYPGRLPSSSPASGCSRRRSPSSSRCSGCGWGSASSASRAIAARPDWTTPPSTESARGGAPRPGRTAPGHRKRSTSARPSPDASVFARPTQPPSVTRAILASGAPLTWAVTVTVGAGRHGQRLAGPCCRRAAVARCAEHQVTLRSTRRRSSARDEGHRRGRAPPGPARTRRSAAARPVDSTRASRCRPPRLSVCPAAAAAARCAATVRHRRSTARSRLPSRPRRGSRTPMRIPAAVPTGARPPPGRRPHAPVSA